MKYSALFLFLSVLLLQSCFTTMKVKVQVIDRGKIRVAPSVVAETVFSIAEQVEANLNNGLYTNMRETLKDAIRKVKKYYLEENKIEEDFANVLFDAVENTVDSVMNSAMEHYIKGLDLYYQASAKEGKGKVAELEKKRLFQQARYLFHSGDASLRYLNHRLDEDFKVRAEEDDAEAVSINQEQKKTLERAEQKLREGLIEARLMNDPLLSAMIHAPEKYWKGLYNKTVARNYFWNSDVAIAMKSWGDYTIKGVRMDAGDIVASSYKAMNFGIKLLAGTFGVAPQGMAPQIHQEGENTAQALPLINPEREMASLEKKQQLGRLAAVSMLDAILSRTDQLINDDKIIQTLGDLDIIYDTFKTQLTNSHE